MPERMEGVQDISVASKKKYSCDACKRQFSQQGLWKHNQKFHPDIAKAKARVPKLKCGLCNELLLSQIDICNHISAVHQMAADVKDVEFSSRAEFEKWKTTEEDTRKCTFSNVSSTKLPNSKTAYFHCHRSGQNLTKAADERTIRAPQEERRQIRIGFQCTAFISARTDSNGIIYVQYCFDHYGHDDEVRRLRLSQNTRQQIAIQLLDDRNSSYILSKNRGSLGRPTGNDSLGRGQTVRRDDISNIERSLGLRKYQKHPTDFTSIAMWVKEFENADDSPFFVFQPLTASDGLFILGIQTKSQEEMLRKFGPVVICVDATHGTTQYKDFLLVTILVVADDSKGYPAAWFVVNRETEEILTLCFKALRDKMGSICTKFFMSDDAPQYFKAWTSIFGDCEPEPRKLLCKWHVKKNWEKNIRSKVPSDHRASVRKATEELIEADTDALFRHLIVAFNRSMATLCPEFLQYFRTYYCNSPLRIEEWSLYGRRNSCVTTNTHLESFHDKLKNTFLEGKQNKRLDKLVDVLINDASAFYEQEYAIIKTLGLPASTHRMRQMHKRHRNSWQLQDKVKDQVRMVEGGWSVPSENTAGFFYRVCQIKANCDCLLKCRWCHVCPHNYSCTCKDMKLAITACKHIHLVRSTFSTAGIPPIVEATVTSSVSSITRSVPSSVGEPTNVSNALAAEMENSEVVSTGTTVETEEQAIDSDGRGAEVDEIEAAIDSASGETDKSPERRDILVALAKSCFSQVEQMENPNEIVTAVIKRKFKEIENIIKIAGMPLAIPPSSEEFIGPANKKSRRQRRY